MEKSNKFQGCTCDGLYVLKGRAVKDDWIIKESQLNVMLGGGAWLEERG